MSAGFTLEGPADLDLSARTPALQHRVPKSGLWKGFSGAPTAAFAAVGYLANAWNKDHRFSRAYVDEEGNIWLESELDLSGGVSLVAVRAFLGLFRDHSLPDFMAHIGFEP